MNNEAGTRVGEAAETPRKPRRPRRAAAPGAQPKAAPPTAGTARSADESPPIGDCPDCARMNVRLFHDRDLDERACIRCMHALWQQVAAFRRRGIGTAERTADKD